MPQEETIALLLGFGMFVVLPIVWLLLAHQRKMAELLHKQTDSAEGHRLNALEDMVARQQQEIETLKAHLTAAIINSDDLQDRDRQEAG